MDNKVWSELCLAEELTHSKGDMVIDSRKSFTAEQKWEVLMMMLKATIAIQDAMREDFMSHARGAPGAARRVR